MSWQENRRRKRSWYRHYRSLCEELAAKISDEGRPPRADEIILMFYDVYERYRLHKRRKTARSALDSLKLAVADTGLAGIVLRAEPAPPPAAAAERPPDADRVGDGPDVLNANVLASLTLEE